MSNLKVGQKVHGAGEAIIDTRTYTKCDVWLYLAKKNYGVTTCLLYINIVER